MVDRRQKQNVQGAQLTRSSECEVTSYVTRCKESKPAWELGYDNRCLYDLQRLKSDSSVISCSSLSPDQNHGEFLWTSFQKNIENLKGFREEQQRWLKTWETDPQKQFKINAFLLKMGVGPTLISGEMTPQTFPLIFWSLPFFLWAGGPGRGNWLS